VLLLLPLLLFLPILLLLIRFSSTSPLCSSPSILHLSSPSTSFYLFVSTPPPSFTFSAIPQPFSPKRISLVSSDSGFKVGEKPPGLHEWWSPKREVYLQFGYYNSGCEIW
jgi:hypothetical protein